MYYSPASSEYRATSEIPFSGCSVFDLCPWLTALWNGIQCVIVVVPGHTCLLSVIKVVFRILILTFTFELFMSSESV